MAIIFNLRGSSLQFFTANIVIAFVLWVLTITIYVATHAITALVIGANIYIIRIGSGPEIFEKTIYGFQFSIGKFLIGGSYRIAFSDLNGLKRRGLFLYGSGIVVHALLTLFLLPRFNFSDLNTTFAFETIFFLTNAYFLFRSVIPRKTDLTGTFVDNNASYIRALLTQPDYAAQLHAAYFHIEGGKAYDEKKYDRAFQLSEDGLKLYPQNFALQISHSFLLYKMGHSLESIQIMEELLAAPNLSLGEKASLYNNLSWILLINNYDIKKALDYAKRAYAVLPWEATVEGTLGAALIESGQYEQGLGLVLQAYEHHEIQSSKATNLAFAAISSHYLGDHQAAVDYFGRAIAIDSTADGIVNAQRVLGK
ncbi:MAG: hypothetical protein AAF490_28545 [Chloroflexota bacterium]